MRKIPSLQRRHFELIAETLREIRLYTTNREDFETAVRVFARNLSHTNPQFNRERFHDAAWRE